MAEKRKLFEEVGQANTVRDAPKPGLIDKGTGRSRGPIRIWLICLFVLVAAMIAVGGLTRLTDSGLSITEWRPVTGALPPLNEADWQAEFGKYQQSPEFQLQNHQMDLAAFKSIYWWEWGHRQLGRLVGLVWAAGFLFFLLRGALPAGWPGRLFILGGLGGLQGAIGWWMVSSGLSGAMVDVASYRLAVHLGLAFAILGLIFWYVMLLSRSEGELLQARRQREGRLFSLATGVMHFAFLQILLGALVAGIDAGRSFPTWPLMGEGFFPPDAFYVPDGPAWRAFFENPGLVQFVHRLAGYLLFGFGLFVWLKGRRSAHPRTARAFDWVAVMLFGQAVLGIITVLHGAPLHLGLAHQMGAVALWVLVLRARFLSQYPSVQSIRGAR
ncbi:MAG: COX15/CtaA family protein [Rhodobacteraceae bacterium]|nr:COX15/CtaA family protein [Paracoccaceae bacterium]